MTKGKAIVPRIKNSLIIIVLLLMSFIFLYAGHFLFNGENAPQTREEKSGTAERKEAAKPAGPPVIYKHSSIKVNGNKQEVNLLEIDPAGEGIEIKPILSYNSIFGFEKLSVMAERAKAHAATNAGFFYEYGQPGGMVAIDGEIITMPTGKYPVFMVSGGRASLGEMKLKLKLAHNGENVTDVDDINAFAQPGKVIAYTPYFGSDNRAKISNGTLAVRDKSLTDFKDYPGSSEIPGDGMLVSFFKPYPAAVGKLQFNKGDSVEVIAEPALPPDCQAYECGSWIVRDGQVVIGDRDEWVGLLTNRDPRTAIGIKEDGKVLLMTVDGRQPGYSAGLTAKELGELLLQYGAKNAAMLDGGASTEMIVEGKLVNRPSFKGQERLMGGGLLVIKKEK